MPFFRLVGFAASLGKFLDWQPKGKIQIVGLIKCIESYQRPYP